MAGTNRSGGNRVAGDDPFPQDGEPVPPSDLSAEERKVWTTLLDQLPASLLRRVDRWQLGSLCKLIVRESAVAGLCRDNPDDSKLGRYHLATVQQIGRLSAQFGLSPVDRQRIRLSKASESEPDPMNELLARMGARN